MRILLSILLVLLLVPTWAGEPRIARFRDGATLRVLPLAMPPGIRSGRLTFLKGWELDSRDPAFGGFGALVIRDGRFLLVGDSGTTLAFDWDGEGQASRVAFGALPDGPGTGWRKEHRDSESLAIDPATGRGWIGFEPSELTRPAIWRYAPGLVRAEASAEPPEMRRWPVNAGAEALVRWPDGRFAAFSERARRRRGQPFEAIAYAGDPTLPGQRRFRFGYRPPVSGMSPTDAAVLPDGDLIVVNRSVSLAKGFQNALAIVRRSDIRPGGIARGRPIGRIRPPLPQDNYEGVAVTQETGGTIVYVLSDDNESVLQRTWLLKFRLEPPTRKGPPRRNRSTGAGRAR